MKNLLACKAVFRAKYRQNFNEGKNPGPIKPQKKLTGILERELYNPVT
jgi:hypothetical protein